MLAATCKGVEIGGCSALSFGGDFGFGAMFGRATPFFLGDGGYYASTSGVVWPGPGVGAR